MTKATTRKTLECDKAWLMKVIAIPALTDNYIFFIQDEKSSATAIVDPGESQPVIDFLKKNDLHLDFILVTHHHGDHTDGIREIKRATSAKVIGFQGDAHRIFGLDKTVKEGDKISIGRADARILEIPGHTTGHIAFYFESDSALFCGDTLFSLGCGRLFEGTTEQMYTTLSRISKLPKNTKIYCGHEYTEKNCRFALSLEPNRRDLLEFHKQIVIQRSQNQPTVPSKLETELHLNPFLRCNDSALRISLGLPTTSALSVFEVLRQRRNTF